MLGLDFQEAFFLVFAGPIVFVLAWVLAGGIVLAIIEILSPLARYGRGKEE
jgi:hypothetical protein